MSKTVTVHTLVQNEERYLWFSVMSVINFVDKVFIWDTGSSDRTQETIKELQKINPGKIYFKEVGKVDTNEFTLTRQKMLKETGSDWLILVDGDEVWWEDSIKAVVSLINEEGNSLDTIVSKYINPVGDIYHFQDESAGRYKIDEMTGFYNIRAINMNIEGLNILKPHGQQGFFDKNNVLIQDMDKKRRKIIADPCYLHFTNVLRSSKEFDSDVPKRSGKYKYELGKSFPLDFYYPEVFFRNCPSIVPSPWVRRNKHYFLRASIETPLKIMKRRLFRSKKTGY